MSEHLLAGFKPRWPFCFLLLGMIGPPVHAQGLELSLGFTDQSTPAALERAKGLSFRGGWDLAGSGGFHLQAQGGFQHNEDTATRRNTSILGLHGSWWSPSSEFHAMGALEWRGEKWHGPDYASQTFGRAWLRAGFGFRGILVPLWPTSRVGEVRGGRWIVPFTRVTLGRAITGATGPSGPLPRRADLDYSLEMGLRFHLDGAHLGRD